MKYLLRFFILIFVLGILVTCEKDNTTPNSESEPDPTTDFMAYEGNSGVIGAAGGEIKVTDTSTEIYGASITIPEGALTTNTQITVVDTDNFGINGNEINVLKFFPSGLQFNKPIKIGIPISHENNSNIAVYNFTEDDYSLQQLDLIEVDQQKKIAYASTVHFSLFIAVNSELNLPEMIGTFVDLRDDQNYNWIKIGNQIWMAENLNYETSSGSLVYNNNTSNAKIYGRLYDWETACNVCPEGWHLSTSDEWTELIGYIDAQKGPFLKRNDFQWEGLSIHLKSMVGWEKNGIDDFGFSALPGGYYDSNNSGNFNHASNIGFWWTSTGAQHIMDNTAWSFFLYSIDDLVAYGANNSAYRMSVRCVKD